MVTQNSANNKTGASGKILQGQGVGTASDFSTATYPSTAGSAGKILISDGTNIISSTPTYPNTSGTSGKILVSDGTNNVYSTPTFPNASATSRKIIVSDGTNWVASTETWATPSTSGNFLTSDGTNWVSTTLAAANILSVNTNITSAQIKALHATPIQLVAAPGSGKIIVILNSIMAKFNYGGTNVFTASASQTVNVYYGTTINALLMLGNATITGTTSGYAFNPGSFNLNSADNKALNLYNPVATEISGNAANDNTISVAFYYYIATLT